MTAPDVVVPPDTTDHDQDLSLREAARVYCVSTSVLSNRIRWGQLSAYKSRGVRGWEWRVSPQALEALGYRLRTAATGDGAPPVDPRVADLEREVAALRQLVAAERRRADLADGELGHALLECGRLRSALARAVAAHEVHDVGVLTGVSQPRGRPGRAKPHDTFAIGLSGTVGRASRTTQHDELRPDEGRSAQADDDGPDLLGRRNEG